MRSCAASVLVLLVTFDLWVSLVSVFLCLFLGLVVFCSGLLGRGWGAVWDPLQQFGRVCAHQPGLPACPRPLGGPTSPAALGFACVCQVWADPAAGPVRLGVIPGPPRCFQAPTSGPGWGLCRSRSHCRCPRGHGHAACPPAVFLLVSSQPARLRPRTPALFL